MQKLTIFYLQYCPYCRDARRALAELQERDATLAAVPVEWVEEEQNPKLADQYDYYRVPSIFLGRRKLYEASPVDGYALIKDRVRISLRTACDSRETDR